MAYNKLKRKIAFTLAELIIVMTILGIILGLASISLPLWIKKTRDSKRLGDLNIILSGLENYQFENNSYPTPDDYITISNGLIDLNYQGYADKIFSKKIGLKSPAVDPNDSIPYTYAVSKDNKQFQIITYLESDFKGSSFLKEAGWFNNSYAQDNTGRYIVNKGDSIGIFLNSDDLSPIQTNHTSLNLENLNDEYTVYFPTNSSTTGTGSGILTSLGIYQQDYAKYDTDLAFYLNFDNVDGNIVYDSSYSAITGSNLSGVLIQEGLLGKGARFNYNGSIEFQDSDNSALDIDRQITINFWINAFDVPSVESQIIRKSAYGVRMGVDGKISGVIGGNNVSYNMTYDKRTMVSIVYNQSQLEIYLNGELVNFIDATNNISVSNDSLKIGDINFNGILDEIRIYKRAFDEDEIKFLYESIK